MALSYSQGAIINDSVITEVGGNVYLYSNTTEPGSHGQLVLYEDLVHGRLIC
jgi:hypothetical protein